MDEFNNIPLSFEYDGHIISGTLIGNTLNWEFISHDEVFTGYFPKGILVPRISFNPSEMELDDLLNWFYEEADKLIL
jgi:hypothetical protein